LVPELVAVERETVVEVPNGDLEAVDVSEQSYVRVLFGGNDFGNDLGGSTRFLLGSVDPDVVIKVSMDCLVMCSRLSDHRVASSPLSLFEHSNRAMNPHQTDRHPSERLDQVSLPLLVQEDVLHDHVVSGEGDCC